MSNIRSELYIRVCGRLRNTETRRDQFADIPDGFYKFLAYFSGKREHNPGIDRPNARYNSALWLRAASPEKKRNASLMARAGLERRERVRGARRRRGRGGGMYAPRFSDPRSPSSPLCDRAPVARIQREGKLRRAASRSRTTTSRPYPAYDSRCFSQEAVSPCRRSEKPTPFEANRSIRAVIRAGSRGDPVQMGKREAARASLEISRPLTALPPEERISRIPGSRKRPECADVSARTMMITNERANERVRGERSERPTVSGRVDAATEQRERSERAKRDAQEERIRNRSRA